MSAKNTSARRTSATASGIIAGLIILMFSYAALSKLTFYEESRKAMLNQVFPKAIALQLVWLVPAIEIATAVLMLFDRTRLRGFYASALLMTAFTLYIAFSMSGAFGRIPCSCGGILVQMDYNTHLIFNLFFLALSLTGIFIEQPVFNPKRLHLKKERRKPGNN
jgi:putative oxidoreductase